MFEKVELFTKRDNTIELPNKDWTDKSRIHCTCELSLGFGGKNIVWTHGNSIRLTKMIEFYNSLCHFATSSSETKFMYEFTHNDFVYVFDCTKHMQTVLYTLKVKYYNRERILLEKRDLSVHYLKSIFFIDTIRVLTSSTNNEVSTKIGELFFKDQYLHNYELKIGQKVKTLISENINTERVGYVIDRFYHDKHRTHMYLIMENNRLLTTRYRPSELEITD